MSDQYAGDPTTFPDDFPIPDDSDPPTAAAVDPALEALGDRTAYLFARLFAVEAVAVTASGTVVAPATAIGAFMSGSGGGGGGCGGMCGAPSDFYGAGGGGGGGAILYSVLVEIFGGESYAVAIGAGGTGGTGATSEPIDGVGNGTNAGDGGDTTVTRVSTSTVIARFRGAQGGGGGARETYGAGGGGKALSIGGSPVKQGGGQPTGGFRSIELEDTSVLYHTAIERGLENTPQHGGYGGTNNFGWPFIAGYSPQGFAGGTSGGSQSPNQAANKYAGGPGGGGGAGPFGVGANGGIGGDANNAGAGVAGTAGSAAAANSGAGGGGGGAGGGGTVGTSAGGPGGAGGSGRLVLMWLCRGAP